MFDLDDARSFAPLQMMSMRKVHFQAYHHPHELQFCFPKDSQTTCTQIRASIPVATHNFQCQDVNCRFFSGGSAKNTGSPPENPLDMGNFEQIDVFVGALFS